MSSNDDYGDETEAVGERPIPAHTVPRQLGFYRNASTADPHLVGRGRLIAWGLRFNDGSALSITTVEGRPSITMWRGVEDAVKALDAYVATPDEAGADGLPRLLVFYQDHWDNDGTAVGWQPIAWGLQIGDGSAVTMSIAGRPSVTLWHSVKDAAEALDAHVDTVDPQPQLPAEALPELPASPVASVSPPGSGSAEPATERRNPGAPP